MKQQTVQKNRPPRKAGSSPSVKIIPLGGLGYIGKNITLFEYKDEILIVDCGISFPTEETPGIDFIIPDFTYITQNKKKVKGIVITHGHEDHIGAVPFLLNIVNAPVYGTKLTLGLIQSRLEERPPKNKPHLIEIKPRETRKIGPFSIEFIHVNHSIIGGVGLAINTDIGTIIHTGDFKIDFSPVDGAVTDIYRFADYGEKGVLLLMSDSTNATKSGFTKSESILVDKLIDVFAEAKGRIIVATFASNIHRIQQVMDVAQRFNRKVAISGMSMQKNIDISRTLGFLTVKDDLIVNVEQANSLPHKKLVVIGTGTQGEPMSALSRMANGTHRHFKAEKGDTVVITASVIPGNERFVTNVINSLMSLGASVYYDQDEAIHVSGHGSSKELKLMLSITKPRFFLPIHGEYRHMKAHVQIAETLGIKPSHARIAKCGEVLELSKNSFKRINTLNLAQIYVDGSETGDTTSSVITDRNAMSSEGIVMLTAVISQGMLLREPEIVTRGVVGDSSRHIIETIRKDTEKKLTKMLHKTSNPVEIEGSIKTSLKSHIYKLTRRNSIVIVKIIEV